MVPLSAGPWRASALAAGGSVLLFMAPWFIPLLGALVSLWAPLPLVLAYRQKGLTAGRRALVLALMGAWLTSALFNSVAGGLYFLFYAAVALALGEAPHRRISEPRALGLAALLAMGVVLGLMLGSAILHGQDPLDMWQAYWQRELDTVLTMYGQMGLEADQVGQVREGLTSAARLVLRLAPCVLICGSLLLAWANLLAARSAQRRLAQRGPEFGPAPEALDLWKAPEPLVWLVIVAGGVTWAGDGWWFWAGVNALLVLGVVYFFQGMAVVAYWLNRKNAPRLLRTGLYVLVAVEVFLALLVALAGLFDMWFNFRRLDKEPSA